MKCWCEGKVVSSFHPEYVRCLGCGTFVSIKQTEPGYYDFNTYWHTLQTEKYGFPPIEQRAKDDFNNRIPFWGEQLKSISDCKSILEIGCGPGGFLYYCKKHGFGNCVGIEISEGTCDFVRKTFGLNMICGNFPDVDINEKFDIVCGFDVLEHFQDPLKALAVMQLLGKYVMIQTPCYREEGLSFSHFHAGEHLFIFNENSIKLLFDIIGLKIISSVQGAFPGDITVIGINS